MRVMRKDAELDLVEGQVLRCRAVRRQRRGRRRKAERRPLLRKTDPRKERPSLVTICDPAKCGDKLQGHAAEPKR